MNNILKHESLIWAIADTYRSVGIVDGDVPKAMMPFFALMMVDSRMIRTSTLLRNKLKEEGLSEEDIIDEMKEEMPYFNSMIVEEDISLEDICKNDTNFNQNLNDYLDSYDNETKTLLGISTSEGELEYLNIKSAISRLKQKNILFAIVKQWTSIPFKDYNNSEITTLEEHIKRKWADISAGQFYTPSDIIDLIQRIIQKHYSLNKKDGFVKIYDPTCGGGNMLFGIEDKLRLNNTGMKIQSYGQEISDELYALSKIESRFREEAFIAIGNTLTTDQFENQLFNYIAANPPYGYDWKDCIDEVKERGENQGCYLDNYPSKSDGQLLFFQHILYKMKSDGFGVVVSNGSPLFSGGAGSGESDIRKWILDNNYLEALIQLPKNEFYNTGITTYLWILNKNRSKDENRIKMIDASTLFTKLSKNKGDKSVKINEEQQNTIVNTLFGDIDTMVEDKDDICKVFDKKYFYFNKQNILLKHKDANGKSISDMLPEKKKSILIQNVKTIFNDTNEVIGLKEDSNINYIFDLKQIENEELKDRNKRIQTLLSNIETFKITTHDEMTYFYDEKSESIVKEDSFGDQWFLGNGVIKVSSSYKKATKTQEEKIVIKVELLPKQVKDYEIVPFQEIIKDKVVENTIDEYLTKWVEKDYDKLDNVVGVEINFNKIFYKYEKLRSVDEIFNDIQNLAQEESELNNDIFDLSPVTLNDDEIKSLKD